MRIPALLTVLGLTLGTAACTGMNNTQQSTLSGGAIGAGAGAAGALITGANPAAGALIGGGIGAGVGYLKEELKK